jgi:hypothetical protein
MAPGRHPRREDRSDRTQQLAGVERLFEKGCRSGREHPFAHLGHGASTHDHDRDGRQASKSLSRCMITKASPPRKGDVQQDQRELFLADDSKSRDSVARTMRS